MTAPTLTREDANRAREAAWERHQEARREHDSWARVIAHDAAHGEPCSPETAESLLAARAAEIEARADWMEARERWEAAR